MCELKWGYLTARLVLVFPETYSLLKKSWTVSQSSRKLRLASFRETLHFSRLAAVWCWVWLRCFREWEWLRCTWRVGVASRSTSTCVSRGVPVKDAAKHSLTTLTYLTSHPPLPHKNLLHGSYTPYHDTDAHPKISFQGNQTAEQKYVRWGPSEL